MISLEATIRKEVGRPVKNLRKKGLLPAVLYGPKIKSENLELDKKDFEKIYKQAGESTIINLKIKKSESEDKEAAVLIKEISRDSVTGEFLHIDFLQPKSGEKIEVKVPIIFEGEAPAVKNFGGTFIKTISEIQVKAFPKDLPKEIKVDISGLESFENRILIKDLKLAEGVEVSRGSDEILAYVASPEKVEEELAKPVEEKVEEVEKIEKEKKPAAEGEAAAESASAKVAASKEEKNK